MHFSGKWHKHGPPRFPCPCCDYITLSELGFYEICPICDWEDEGLDPELQSDLDAPPGPNSSTLRKARIEFNKSLSLGDIDPAIIGAFVRKGPQIPGA